MDPKGRGCGIWREAAYPGERASSEKIAAGAVVSFKRRRTIGFVPREGSKYRINFFELSNGRGWVHDFKTDKPGSPNLELLPVIRSTRHHLVGLG